MSRVRADPITAALAHPTRRNLYTSLFDVEEMSTVQLQKLVDVDRYNLYHHLKKLASLDLIENHRDEGRARWWKISRRVEIPGVVNASNIAVSPLSCKPSNIRLMIMYTQSILKVQETEWVLNFCWKS
ncbi:MAG: hypothetical protein CM15mP8_2650 [Methanobacteriota archaeon]|nr:MAG: hypothetical protein CM15mP8_2650 [Euryarchaeota archaeon]